MPTPMIPIRYRRNPSRGWRGENGRKTYDEQSGQPTYEAFLIEDDFGVKVDSRKNTFDYDYRLDNSGR